MPRASSSDRDLLDLPVADLLERWPVTAGVFLRHCMACIGCVFSGMDTARQALDAHGIEHDGFRRQLTQAIGSHAGAGARPDQSLQEK